MRTRQWPWGLVLAAAVVGGCQDLDVTNPNDPDRERATQQPSSVESFAASSFRQFWEWTHDDSPVWVLTTTADELTAAFGDFGALAASSEPRQAWNNTPSSGTAEANRDPWYGLYSVISTVNDALLAIDSGLTISDGGTDVTRRAEAVAKLMQGLAHGHVALYFDRGYIVDETVDVDTLTNPEFRPYAEVMDSAVAQLQQAIAIADANAFTLPGENWLFTAMDNQGVSRLAHSYTARFLAGVGRTRAERDAVDWERVLAEANAGITEDFAPVAVPDVLEDYFKAQAARSRSTIPGDFARVDYFLVGPADSTDGFITWLATPPANRNSFRLRTKDRRIEGATPADTLGTYFGYTPTNRFQASRGTYHQSRYFFRRFGQGDPGNVGPQLAMTVTEMDLLKAEALIRLGRPEEAVPLVNKSRVANGALPPVTVDGPPDEPGCVPRKQNGQCGSLWDALRYEKRIEMAGVDPTVAFIDARGWQTLVVNSFVHLPVPGRELETRQQPLYTFGGGGEGSAPAPDPERCPVALPRCP